MQLLLIRFIHTNASFTQANVNFDLYNIGQSSFILFLFFRLLILNIFPLAYGRVSTVPRS